MAGTFAGIAGAQQFKLTGSDPRYGSQPMAGGKLYVYQANTTTLVSTFQDIGLTEPEANPLTLDDTGRVPMFYVADGNYGLTLTDSEGVTSNGGFAYQSVPAIGNSQPATPAPPVDPNAIYQTGDVKWLPTTSGQQTTWVRCNGRTIGSASSGASERANADCQALFKWLWNTVQDAYCPVVGGRGASASADWAANKQITLLDMRGRGPFGVDDMGNAPANRLTNVSTTTPYDGGSSGGLDKVTLITAQLPIHSHTLTNGTATIATESSHTHGASGATPSFITEVSSGSTSSIGTGGVPVAPESNTGAGTPHTHVIGGSTDGAGGNNAHQNMPPFALGTFYMKL